MNIFVLLLIVSAKWLGLARNLPEYEITTALNDLYVSTDGYNWLWDLNEQEIVYGAQSRFSRPGGMYDPKEYSEVAISKGSIMRKDAVRPSQVYIDIGFPNGEKFDTLLFQNFYTSSISITQQSSSGQVSILENYILMPNAYSESGAQLWFAIESSMFSNDFMKGKPMRILLFQPSAQWHKFEIRNIKALCKAATPVAVTVDKSPAKVDSISELLWSDYKILYEASRNAQYSGGLPDTMYVYSESRKSSKKKERRKKSVMTNNPSSNSFGV